jgi:hypothetical protein
MNKDFVPYKESLELKELGFDEPCFTKFEDYFNKTKLHPILATLHLNTPYENEYNGYDQKIINDQSKRWFFTGYKNSVKDHNNDILSAPTFSQAFRFFRENYKLYSYIEPTIFVDDNSIVKYDYVILVDDNSPTEVYNNLPCDKFEEAELACLVTLIKIVKQKQ